MQFAGGSPLYVAKKMKWLKSQGWEVVVFDHFGGLQMNKPIDLPEFMKFEKNRFLELFFTPSYFSRAQRTSILDRMIDTIGYADEYVIETNTSRLALWGELLAQRLGGKHLIMDVTEHPDIRTRDEFKYFDYKLSRNELFFISPNILQSFFAEYKEIERTEAEKHVFRASMDAPVAKIRINELDDLPKSDFKILSFGRYKPYFDNMISGIVKFAKLHHEKKINLVFVGEVTEEQIQKMRLKETKNLHYKMLPSMRPIPQQLFEYFDIVIAAAGCALLAYNEGAKTISMSIDSGKPLGVLGYTTNKILVDNESSVVDEDVNVESILKDALIDHKFDSPQTLERKTPKEEDYKLSAVNNDRSYWKGVDKITHDRSKCKILIQKLILRLNLTRLFAKY